MPDTTHGVLQSFVHFLPAATLYASEVDTVFLPGW